MAYPKRSLKKRVSPLQKRLDYINTLPNPNSYLLEEAASLRWVINLLAEEAIIEEIENVERNN